MLLKVNRTLRKFVLVIGALCVIFKLADCKASKKREKHEGFQTAEFDDIW